MTSTHPDAFDGFMRFLLVFVLACVAIIGGFGEWRRGLESLGIGDPLSLVVAIVGDVVLLSIFLLSDAAFNRFLRPRPDIRGSDFLGGAFSLGVKIGVIYLYGWISVRGGGDWTALA